MVLLQEKSEDILLDKLIPLVISIIPIKIDFEASGGMFKRLNRLVKISNIFVCSNIDTIIENITIKPQINNREDIDVFIASVKISPRLDSLIKELLLIKATDFLEDSDFEYFQNLNRIPTIIEDKIWTSNNL